MNDLGKTERCLHDAAVSSLQEYRDRHEQTRSIIATFHKAMIYHGRTEEEIDEQLRLIRELANT